MPLPESTAFLTVKGLGSGLRQGRFSAVQLTEFFLDRLERLGPKYNAVVTVTRELALDEARQADEELASGRDRGPLHGIPYGVKDLLATKGIPTSWGAAPLKDQMLDLDATVIERLRAAGGVLVAKLAMVELAGGFGYRQANASFTGPGLNPWNRSRWSGGSSSGSGSAVGAGLVPFAIGSETWGSIVTPAAYCGITGLRPTYGRVSRFGAMALSWTLDKLGPMAHSAEDCGLVLAAMAGPDPNDPTAADVPPPAPMGELPSTVRLAVPADALDHLQKEVRANFDAALKVLASWATIDEIELPEWPYSAAASIILSSEMAAAFETFITSGDVWELTAEEDHWGGHAALMIPAKDYINAMRIRGPIQKALDELFIRYDALVSPTRATVASPIDRPFSEYWKGYSTGAIGGAGNLAGLPAITVPNGFGEENLPTALQFVGRAFDESRLIALAHRYQSATDWHKRHPKLEED